MSKLNYGKRFANSVARGAGYNSQADHNTFVPSSGGGSSSNYVRQANRVEVNKCPPQPEGMTRKQYIEWLKNRE